MEELTSLSNKIDYCMDLFTENHGIFLSYKNTVFDKSPSGLEYRLNFLLDIASSLNFILSVLTITKMELEKALRNNPGYSFVQKINSGITSIKDAIYAFKTMSYSISTELHTCRDLLKFYLEKEKQTDEISYIQ